MAGEVVRHGSGGCQWVLVDASRCRRLKAQGREPCGSGLGSDPFGTGTEAMTRAP